MSRRTALWNRWLGVGLASSLAVVTLWLAATGRLALYINPSSNWFAIPMAVLLLVGAALSFLLPLGAEEDHGHDHGAGGVDHDHGAGLPAPSANTDSGIPGDTPFARRVERRVGEVTRIGAATEGKGSGAAPTAGTTAPTASTTAGISDDTPFAGPIHRRVADDPRSCARHGGSRRAEEVVSTRSARSTTAARSTTSARSTTAAHSTARTEPKPRPAAVLGLAGGVAASAVVGSILLVPPAALSAELAQSRDVGAAPLFAGADVVALATHGDTAGFGVGDWASVFATSTNPDGFEGDAVTLTGFVTPGDDGAFDLTRLVITHCVIDAQPASVPVALAAKAPATGQWITVTGTVRSAPSGALQIDATEVKPIAEPQDPYEY